MKITFELTGPDLPFERRSPEAMYSQLDSIKQAIEELLDEYNLRSMEVGCHWKFDKYTEPYAFGRPKKIKGELLFKKAELVKKELEKVKDATGRYMWRMDDGDQRDFKEVIERSYKRLLGVGV